MNYDKYQQKRKEEIAALRAGREKMAEAKPQADLDSDKRQAEAKANAARKAIQE
jgi:hypothetical protein